MIVTDLIHRLRERAAAIELATRGRKERYQSLTGKLLLEAADMVELLINDTHQLHDICDRNEEDLARMEASLRQIRSYIDCPEHYNSHINNIIDAAIGAELPLEGK